MGTFYKGLSSDNARVRMANAIREYKDKDVDKMQDFPFLSADLTVTQKTQWNGHKAEVKKGLEAFWVSAKEPVRDRVAVSPVLRRNSSNCRPFENRKTEHCCNRAEHIIILNLVEEKAVAVAALVYL